MRAVRLRALLAAIVLFAGCAMTRVVPVPASGVSVDPVTGAVTVAAAGVQIVVRPSAWQGSPTYLAAYVTPFHVLVVNETAQSLDYQYGDLQLFDESRFQYTALPPLEVERILRAAGADAGLGRVAAAAGADSRPILRRRVVEPFLWDPWWWGPYPYPYYPSRLDDVFLEALPVGPLQPGARTQGFAYFPRLRPGVSRLTFEFRYHQGDAERVLVLPFGVERG